MRHALKTVNVGRFIQSDPASNPWRVNIWSTYFWQLLSFKVGSSGSSFTYLLSIFCLKY